MGADPAHSNNSAGGGDKESSNPAAQNTVKSCTAGRGFLTKQAAALQLPLAFMFLMRP